jgi:hypothetical protein
LYLKIRGRIGVPEFTIPRGLEVSIEDGTEIWKYLMMVLKNSESYTEVVNL